MADNYLQFAETLDALTPEEADWLREQLAEDPATACPRFLADFPDRQDDDSDYGFQYDFQDSQHGRYLWISAEERGDVLRVAHLVQKFVRRFRPTQCWSLTYATTCSTLRPGEFGGGGVFVTADEVCSSDGYGFIEDKRQTFERRLSKQRPPRAESHVYDLRVAGDLLVRQQGLLAEVIDAVRHRRPYLSQKAETEDLLEGVLSLLDEIADQVAARERDVSDENGDG